MTKVKIEINDKKNGKYDLKKGCILQRKVTLMILMMIVSINFGPQAYCQDIATTNSGGIDLQFTYKGVALHYDDLKRSPRKDLIHPSIIDASKHIHKPLGKYYLYYSPHAHAGISMAYSDSLDGPWTEYKANPILSRVAAADIRWIADEGKYFMWAHGNNSKTEFWTTEDGIKFEHQGIAIKNKVIGSKNATYTRVYEYPVPKLGNKYVMVYSALKGGLRSVWLAHSKDARKWTQLTKPLVSPVAGEKGQIYGPSFLRWNNRNYIFYQDNTSKTRQASGGKYKYVELNDQLDSIGSDGKRYLFLDPPSEAPIYGRYRGGEFYRSGNTMYLFTGAADKGKEIIVKATARIK